MKIYKVIGKRTSDIVFSFIALCVLSPVLILVAALIFLEDRGCPFYKSVRIGKNGSKFTMFKFRSMPVGTRQLSSKQGIDLEKTKFGHFLRRSNIDELPQLFNVLCGQMSLIGPRPCLPEQHDLIHWRRLNNSINCLPGLTGLAQVRAYDGMSEQEKAKHDEEYCKGLSLKTDLGIVFKTIAYLTRKPPIY